MGSETVKRPPQQPAHPRHANHWAPRTRKRHQQEHRPQRLTKRSDPTQHAKGRKGDCPGPRKETATRRNVTRGGGGYTVWPGLINEPLEPFAWRPLRAGPPHFLPENEPFS